MKKTIYTFFVLLTFVFVFQNSYSQQKVYYTYTRPTWTVGFGPEWNLATNDAYGRANYQLQDEILRDNYGMRWGYGGYIYGKYSPGKLKNDRIFLGADYKLMQNSDFDNTGNKTKYNIVTIDAGYEYLFYGTYTFRSYYGGGVTANIISGNYNPNVESFTNKVRSFNSSLRVGMELKAGLEFVFSNRKRNFGVNLGATYNLMNLFNNENIAPLPGQTTAESLNDGSAAGGPGFKRYIGMVSVTLGLNIFPDVKRIKHIVK